MSDDKMTDEIAPDFGTITVDGAYLHFPKGFVRLLFYRDTAFPSDTKNGFPRFDNKRREILHETRLSYEAASKLSSELDHGLKIYDEYGSRAFLYQDVVVSRIVTHVSKVGGDAAIEARLVLLNGKLKTKMQLMDAEGQNLFVQKMLNFLEEKRDEIAELAMQHPIKKEK